MQPLAISTTNLSWIISINGNIGESGIVSPGRVSIEIFFTVTDELPTLSGNKTPGNLLNSLSFSFLFVDLSLKIGIIAGTNSSASPIRNASKKGRIGSGLKTLVPPATTIGWSFCLSLLWSGIPARSSIERMFV